jgi:hypothetical protein
MRVLIVVFKEFILCLLDQDGDRTITSQAGIAGAIWHQLVNKA